VSTGITVLQHPYFGRFRIADLVTLQAHHARHAATNSATAARFDSTATPILAEAIRVHCSYCDSCSLCSVAARLFTKRTRFSPFNS
jgi:hypothetical protein